MFRYPQAGSSNPVNQYDIGISFRYSQTNITVERLHVRHERVAGKLAVRDGAGTDEFAAYNEYAEYCKVEVKRRMIEERSSPGDGDERPNT